MSARAQHASPDRGQASIVVIAIVAVLVTIAASLIGLAAEEVQRGRLQAVADLTALAAAHGDALGSAVAGHNGARLIELRHGADSAVSVVVERDGRRATAAATS